LGFYAHFDKPLKTKVIMNSIPDKNGKNVSAGDVIDVDAGERGTDPRNDFQGVVIKVDIEAGEVYVRDQDGDVFNVYSDQITLME
jgi:hypothetical protein